MKTPRRESDSPPPSPITDKLREVIESRCPSAYDAALRSGVDHRVISRFLKRERDLKGVTIDRLATAFNLRLVEIEVKKPKSPFKSRLKPSP